MKKLYFLFSIFILSQMMTMAQDPQLFFNLNNPESGNRHYKASQYINCLPEDGPNQGFSYTATTGETFVAEIDPYLVFPPDEGDSIIGSGDETYHLGMLGSSYQVGNDGSMMYSIPLDFPEARGGIKPMMSLVYKSAAFQGIAGQGFMLSGLSSIHRMSFKFDNDDYNPVDFNNDYFALDGNLLIEAGEANSYKTYASTFSQILSSGNLGGDPLSFSVLLNGGTTNEYGVTNDSRLKYPEHTAVFAWNLNKSTDIFGNYIDYIYDSDGLISEIHYGGNEETNQPHYIKIVFEYSDREAPEIEKYFCGAKVSLNKKLDNISVFKNGELYKKYTIDYYENEILDYIEKVNVENKNGDKLYPISFDWNLDNSTNFVDYPIGSDYYMENDQTYNSRFIGDFNGDGRSDIINFAHNGVNISVSNGNGFSTLVYPNFGYENWGPFSEDGYSGMVGDINGDGKDDLIRIGDDGTYIAYSTGSGYGNSEYYNIFNRNQSGWYASKYPVLLADFDGDGAKEFVGFGQSTSVIHDVLENEQYGVSGFSYANGFTNEAKYPRMIGDVNGDGRDDIIGFGHENVLIKTSNGSGFETYPGYEYLCYSDGFHGEGYPRMTGDFNGDGLTDLIGFGYSGFAVAVSTGNGWESYPGENLFGSDQGWNSDQVRTIADVNGDGLSDIVGFGAYEMEILLSNGNGWEEVISYPFLSNSDGYFHPRQTPRMTGDFNGDGCSDLIGIGLYQTNSCTKLSNLNRNKNFITNVNNGYQSNVLFSYNSKNSYECYQRNSIIVGNNSEIAEFKYPQYLCYQVKEEISETNGTPNYLTNTYYYWDAILSKRGKSFVGFKKMAVQNEETNIKNITTYEFYNNSKILYPRFVRTIYRNEDNTFLTLSEQESNYYKKTNSSGDQDSYFYYVQKTNLHKYDYNGSILGTTRNEYTYDDYGNATEIKQGTDKDIINITAGITAFDFRSTTTNTYKSKNETYNLLSRLETSHIESIAPQIYPSYSKLQYTYYENPSDIGFPKIREELNQYHDADEMLITTFEYDDYGRETKKTVSVPESFEPTTESRTVETIYGSSGNDVLPSEIINANGESTYYTYDDVFDKIETVTSVNNRVTQYVYNDFGELIETISPNGHITKTGNRWVSNNTKFPDAVSMSWSVASGTDVAIEYFDKFGRSIGTKTIDYSGNYVYTKQVYDDLGRIEYVYHPYSDNFNFRSRVTYDEFGRKEYQYNGLTSSQTTCSDDYSKIEYNGFETKVKFPGPNGNIISKTSTVYANGQPHKIIDEDGNEIEYKYYADGNLRVVTAFGEYHTRFEYDVHGNRKKMVDPSLGTINYTHNPYGELLKRTDAKGNTTLYTYDKLGRAKTIEETNGVTITHSYYEKAEGQEQDFIGMLDKTTLVISGGFDESGYKASEVNYSYDPETYYLISKSETFEGQSFAFQYIQDELGRTKYTTYPNGFKTRNKYNSRGFLKEVVDVDNNKSIWEIGPRGYDKKGHLIDYYTNSNIYTIKSYDEEKGFLENITTEKMGSDGGMIQNLQYNYDHLGNMEYRQDLLKSIKEEFLYDDLNRLTDAGIEDASYNLHYDYADNGNIDGINNVGSFSYYDYVPAENKSPYAISGIDFANNVSIPAYQEISYTAFDKVMHLYEEGIGDMNVFYGIDKQRLYQITDLDDGNIKEKYFIGGLYEKEIINGVERELCYISTPAGVVAVKETKSENDNWYFLTHDHLGSVHCILNNESKIEQELSFDPYGNRRDPLSWQPFEDGTEPEYVLDRGYTMHEHWDEFTLINMNGRMYDPMIGRFLSPDPYVQAADYSQNFNRYSYALNNPLKFTDPTGEFWHIVIGAVIGGVVNWATHGFQFNAAGLGYFAVGAAAGALGAGIGAGVGGLMAGTGFSFSVASSAVIGGTGILGGFAVGASAGLVSGFVTGFGNALVGQENIGAALSQGVTSAAWGAAIGGVTGAIGGGIRAHREGVHLWKGYPKHMKLADPGRAAFPTVERDPVEINATRSGLDNSSKVGTVAAEQIHPTKIWIYNNSDSYYQNALDYEDVPYLWGGASRDGTDCSGLVKLATNSEVRWTTSSGKPPGDWSLINYKQNLESFRSTAIKGDLLVWKGDHAAFYAGGNKLFHAHGAAGTPTGFTEDLQIYYFRQKGFPMIWRQNF